MPGAHSLSLLTLLESMGLTERALIVVVGVRLNGVEKGIHGLTSSWAPGLRLVGRLVGWESRGFGACSESGIGWEEMS